LDRSNPADDLARLLCYDCRKHPAARRLGPISPPNTPIAATHADGPKIVGREFTPAERSLIRKVHGFMPAAQLLGILNDRLQADLGPNVRPYTLDQLHAETSALPGGRVSTDWTDLRKLLAKARREGLLDSVTNEVIDDFAVLFALSPAQVLRVKDVVISAKEVARG
jgi:hypothetical protein